MRIVLMAAALGVLAGIAVSCGGSSSSSATPTAVSSPAPSDTVWLCKPGAADNPCESDLTTTVIAADGSTTTETASVAKDPPIDCFYVYPTVSGQTTVNANLNIDPEEQAVAMSQASRFSQVCKVYAPMYRQLTLSTINGTTTGDMTQGLNIAYADVLSAWQDYLAHYNNGRGVVLIGHSQGTMMLTRLISSEIDPNPAERKLLVSALLIGGNVLVKTGQDVGGDFQNVPACRSTDQTGCVVAYSSFDQTPPADSLFGRADTGIRAADAAGKDVEVLCVNPASLSGGTGTLQMYNPTAPLPGALGALVGPIPTASTPWISYPGLYTGTCTSEGGANWLQVDSTNIPGETRPIVTQVLGPTWGLHLVDINIALGNLVDLVRQQTAAFSQ
ncbi:MAG: DUF3089 domain-containing protein [Dehalococcoidia bacterium]|jgi:hypothetical protein